MGGARVAPRVSGMSAAEQLVELIVGTAPELDSLSPSPAARERAVALVAERSAAVRGDAARFAALVDLVVHELTRAEP